MKRLLIILISFLLINSIAIAQSQLNYDNSVSGSVESNGEHTITFEGTSDTDIRIGYSVFSLDFTAELFSPSNQLLTTFEWKNFKDIHLTENGTYSIKLHSEASFSCDYEFYLYLLPFSNNANVLPYDVIKTDSLRPFHEKHISFEGEENSLIQLNYSVWSSSFSTTLYDPNGEELSDIPSYKNSDQILLPMDGTYSFVLKSKDIKSWQYTLFISKLLPLTNVPELENNVTVENTLEHQYDFDRYKIMVQENDTLNIRLELDGMTFLPKLDIIDPQGEIESFKGDNLRELALTKIVDKTGYYGIIVRNPGTENVMDYALKANLNNTKSTIPFNEWTLIDMGPDKTYSARINVPEVDNLFFLLKKIEDDLGYARIQNWDELLNVSNSEGSIFNSDEDPYRSDFHGQVINPQSGAYTLNILSQLKAKALFTEYPPELTMDQWGKGEIFRSYGEDWHMVIVEPETEELQIKVAGIGLFSKIEVYYENIHQKKDYWLLSYLKDDLISGTIKNPEPGRYYIKYIDSALMLDGYGISPDQTREYYIYAGVEKTIPVSPQPLSIESLSTYSVQKGTASIKCKGTGFRDNDIIKLIQGNTEIIGITTLTDTRNTTATFNLNGAVIGEYDFIIENENGEVVESSKPVTIQFEQKVDIDFDVLTREKYRAGFFQPLIVRVTNKGGTDERVIPVILTVPKSIDVKMDDLSSMEYDPDSDLINPNEVSIGTTNADDENMQDIPIIIPKLAPNETYELEFKLRPTLQEDFGVEIELRPPLWDFINALNEAYLKSVCSECSEACINTALGALNDAVQSAAGVGDIGGCASGIADLTGSAASSAASGQNEFYDDAYSGMQAGMGAANTVASCLMAAGKNIPLVKAISIGTSVAGYIFMSAEAAECGGCIADAAKKWFDELGAVGSLTPEDKYGPVGAEVQINDSVSHHYIDTSSVFEYRIDYWNKEDATAPAAVVYIRDTLDTDFDISTLNFTEVGFMRWKMPLEGGQYFNVNVDCRPDMPYLVNIEGTVDYETREVFWVHTTLDTETMEMPEDPFAGYLPPIDSTGYQIGWVNYTIHANSGLPDGTVFTNQAFVNFDGIGKWGPAPKEGPYTNIFDATPPTSFVVDLPLSYDGDSVLVEWEGEDPGCGLINYTIYVSTNGDEYLEWLTTSSQSAWFTGEPGNTYDFYSIATDFVGNEEETKSFAEATIFFNDANGFSRIDGQCISFEVYPNPTSSDAGFTIQFGSNNLLYGGKMQLITTDGRVLFEKLNLNKKMEIKVDRQGIFVLQIVLNNGETLTEKVIVR